MYIIVGGLIVSVAGFVCALIGRLVASAAGRFAWMQYAIFAIAVVNVGLAAAYFAFAS